MFKNYFITTIRTYFISKKIEEIKQSINQQENNLGFFQHVDQNNPKVSSTN